MKKKIADRWIKALLSGKYKQTKGRLHCIVNLDNKKKEESFCCLGVLCDLYQKSARKSKGLKELNSKFEKIGAGLTQEVYDISAAYLSDSVMQWSGIGQNSAHFTRGATTFSLAKENDKGSSFKQIAGLIAENYKIL